VSAGWATIQRLELNGSLTAEIPAGHADHRDHPDRLPEVVGADNGPKGKAGRVFSRLARCGPERAKVHVRIEVEHFGDLVANEDKQEALMGHSNAGNRRKTYSPDGRPESDPQWVIQVGSLQRPGRVGWPVQGQTAEKPVDSPVEEATANSSAPLLVSSSDPAEDKRVRGDVLPSDV